MNNESDTNKIGLPDAQNAIAIMEQISSLENDEMLMQSCDKYNKNTRGNMSIAIVG